MFDWLSVCSSFSLFVNNFYGQFVLVLLDLCVEDILDSDIVLVVEGSRVIPTVVHHLESVF